MKRLLISELEENMIVAADVVSNTGVTFLAKGVSLTEKHILSLNLLGITSVEVEEVETIREPFNSNTEVQAPTLNQTYSKALDKFKQIYEDVRHGNSISESDVKAHIGSLVGEITKQNNLLGQLRLIKINDEYTYKHSVNVGLISTMIGKWLNYSDNDLSNLAVAGFLHDIGKSKIPANIINKPAKLTPEEHRLIQMHPVYSHEILKQSGGFNYDTLFGVLDHHEYTDGTGYPNGSRGSNIHEFGRIIAVADVFDAMTSNRSYKSKISPFKVAELLMDEACNHLDPYITQMFLRQIANFYVGNKVRLSNGEDGEIVMVNKFRLTRPLVKVDDKFYDLSSNYHLEIIDVLE